MDPIILATCVLFSIAGCAVGLMTGLIPGIHVNTLAAILLAMYPSIEAVMTGVIDDEFIPIAVSCIIMSASVVHSFLDFVPSVFIGAPDGEDAISILPGHRLLLKGNGMIAVRSAAIGSLIGCSAAILLAIPLQLLMLSGLADSLSGYTKYVLIAVSCLLLWNEFRRHNLIFGTIAFVLSGLLGWIVMKLPIPIDSVLDGGTLLMPMLSGLFGLPSMLSSSKGSSFPKQVDKIKDPVGFIPGLKGVIMGTVAGWFPGITSTVGATISATIMPDRCPERFISTVASIGTVTSVLSLVTLSVSGGGRSGTVIVIGQILGDSISGPMTIAFRMMLVAAAIGSLLGYLMTIQAGKMASRAISGKDPSRLNKAVIALIIIIVLLTTGPWGLYILLLATLIGFIPVSNDSGKTVLCGCLILPVIFM